MNGWDKIGAIANKNRNDGIDNLMTVLADWDNICHTDENTAAIPVVKSPRKPINEAKIDLNEIALNNNAT
jgi:hypothetical protein